VCLGEIRICDDIPCAIHTTLDWGEEVEETEEKELCERVLQAGFKSASVEGNATPVWLAHLELLPFGRQNIVRPVLRLTSRTHIASAEDFSELTPFGGSEWRVGSQVGELLGPITKGINYVDGYWDEFGGDCYEYDIAARG
jgi:hypothetical protein